MRWFGLCAGALAVGIWFAEITFVRRRSLSRGALTRILPRIRGGRRYSLPFILPRLLRCTRPTTHSLHTPPPHLCARTLRAHAHGTGAHTGIPARLSPSLPIAYLFHQLNVLAHSGGRWGRNRGGRRKCCWFERRGVGPSTTSPVLWINTCTRAHTRRYAAGHGNS